MNDVAKYQRRMEEWPKYYPNRKLLLRFLNGRILDVGCNYGDFHKFVIEGEKKLVEKFTA